MQNKQTYYIPLIIALFTIGGIFLGNMLSPGNQVKVGIASSKSQKIQDILSILDQRYVDSVDVDEIFEKTISDMLHKLDPHSTYISAAEVQRANESIKGEFKGIGVRFFMIRDTICITNVLPNSPSQKAGLLAGDKIVKIDGELVAGIKISTDDVMSKLKGPAGTQVNVTLNRNGKAMKKTLTRGSILVSSVVSPYMINKDVGYIKINSFTDNTGREFRDAAADLLSKGMKRVIVDVRNNGGGILQRATEIADEFLEDGKTILITKGLHEERYEYKSTSRGMLEGLDVVVLINSQSASASEILAGALQDNDKGTIVGRRSFGKGLVQEDRQLADGSILRLTIARYYTPTERSIQRDYKGSFDEYLSEAYERYENGEMFELDSSTFVNAEKFTTPGGKTVYGGGGIFPDVFVPLDSIGVTSYFNQLRYSDVFITFAFDYVNNKRNKWRSVEEFDKQFNVNDALLKDFARYAEDNATIPMNEKGLAESKALIAKYLKAEIANQIWMEDGYYRIINNTDKDVLKALEILR